MEPEFTDSYEFGIDSRFFESRLSFDLSVYYSKSDNQILRDIRVPPSAGTFYATLNGGAIINKGNALSFLQDHHNIKPSETMAFGDYNNDLEMLKCAKYSYAMSNAHPNVKVVAKYKTESNDDFGVEQVLETLISQIGKA